ncbi:hypothetical protein FNJ84_13670 [Paracoccus sp. M683]|uniref:hypothetical protein n=1 Tax=Paracoccus sp. M683 TaxID=2594268 RepID=UPI00117DC779|nr:hypothetical protein [Paracoccus sp. M683]TRW96320.1 hypothetical protein FNJ84_13670 [Paracoccus sp. M683]
MRALLFPALVTVIYTAVTWWLWQAALAPFADLAAEGILTSLPQSDEFRSWELVIANFEYRGPLRVLLQGLPSLASGWNSGLVPFWSVAVQGVIFGVTVWSAINWRRLWFGQSPRNNP